MLTRTRNGVAALTFLIAAVAAFWGARADETSPTVVELFTSQGCSSCPPADAILGQLSGREDLVTLTYNVDYWDYLGWKDTLASPIYTERQRQYARHMSSRTVYTPQMVIGGRVHAVGSNWREINGAIGEDQTRSDVRARVSFQDKGDMVLLNIAEAPAGGEATIWLVRFDKRHDIEVQRGENAGSKLSYFNVVREIRDLGLWRGEAMEIALDREALAEDGSDGCAVLVQRDRFGPIIGAGVMKWTPGKS